MAIYQKSLKKLNISREGLSTGEIINLQAVDAQRFIELPFYINTLWFGPIQILLIVMILWSLFGPSILTGFFVLLMVFPISWLISKKLKSLQFNQMAFKGQRIKIINEMLNGIKVLKLQAWEPSFEEQVKNIRQKEIKSLKKAAVYSALAFFVWTMAPYLVSLATFATYVLIDENHVLTTEKAFVAIALINILKYPMYLFSMLVTFLTQAHVSLKRIANFLNSEELDAINVSHHISENSIGIQRGTFSWYGDKPILKDISIAVKKGSLVAIVGPVGSGKSSLISAILGEMHKISGTVNTDGTIAYVPQQAWIQNCTLEQNILFGRPMDRARYDQIIVACALLDDLKILPGGDQTEIGEKGVNLSGGQKQRISLARAIYSDADIYLLDDPMSAVDSHVGKHIFENVFGENGLLAGKTRFLVTHAISYLPRVDQILVMDNGSIIESGSYKDLSATHGAFSKFLEEYMNVEDDEEKNPDTKEKFIGNTKDEDSKKADRKDQKSQLTEKESAFTGSINFKVYIRYVKNAGILISLLCIGSVAAYQVFAILTNVSLTSWSEDVDSKDPSVRDQYLIIYGGLGIFQGTLRGHRQIYKMGFLIKNFEPLKILESSP
jgi:ATP-binding cassette subfamily C (CFTR/MRP) protein 1